MFFFFFKQKTAYEMRISDWSSDVCSSDLRVLDVDRRAAAKDALAQRGDHLGALDHLADGQATLGTAIDLGDDAILRHVDEATGQEIGRASCRERVCQYV